MTVTKLPVRAFVPPVRGERGAAAAQEGARTMRSAPASTPSTRWPLFTRPKGPDGLCTPFWPNSRFASAPTRQRSFSPTSCPFRSLNLAFTATEDTFGVFIGEVAGDRVPAILQLIK